MLKKDFDQQRAKVILKLNEKFPYWRFKGDLFDKPKRQLIEFYEVAEQLERKSDVWMGKITFSMEPVLPLKTAFVVYYSGSTYMHLSYESHEIYNCISRIPKIKQL